jgi:transcriptional regulator with XRE-family HTH domain
VSAGSARRAIVTCVTVTAITDIRRRRQRIGITRLQLAIRSGVSLSHLSDLEGGLSPRTGSQALAKVEATLDRLEHEPIEDNAA